ncbi:MAG: TerB family tellurite resistance protein [Planctomycetota bacterium]
MSKTPPHAEASDDRDRRLSHLRNLIMMAFADGTLGQREINLVADRCAQLGLSESDLHEAMQHGLSGEASLEIPDTEDQQEALLKDLIRMMAADGVLEESEKQLFAMAAAKMNFSTEKIHRMVDELLGPSDS